MCIFITVDGDGFAEEMTSCHSHQQQSLKGACVGKCMDTNACAYLQAHACPFCGHAHMPECVLSCDCVCVN